MENIPQEVSVSLESLLSLLTATASESDAAAALVTSSDTSSTVFTSSFSSCNNNNNNNGFEIRRAARRLDRALESLERVLVEHDEQEQEEHSSSPMTSLTLGPLLQSHLVTILTTLGQALDDLNNTTTSSSSTLQELYENMAVTTSRILLLNPNFILHQDEQVDALVDRIGALLMTQHQDDAVLYALITCVNTHVLHVQQQQQQQQDDETVVVFPLLQNVEATILAKLVLCRCKDDLARRWNFQTTENCRLDLWSFCTLLLQHVVTQCQASSTATNNNIQAWLQECCSQQQDDNDNDAGVEVQAFLNTSQMFGQDLLEMGLDILDQATTYMETSTTMMETQAVVVQQAIHVTWTCLSTTQVLQEGLELHLSYSLIQSLFTAYASFVAVTCHKQHTEDSNKQFASQLLAEWANFVLLLQQQQDDTTSSTTAPMETALSMTLFCGLDSGMSSTDALLTPILEYMQHSRTNGTSNDASSFQVAKKQRREEVQEESFSFTEILQTCVMASLMVPSNTTSTTYEDDSCKESVARLLHAIPSSSLPTDDNPWHALVSRKVKESFAIDTTTATNGDDENDDTTREEDSSWSSNRILTQYVVNHPQRPLILLEND